MKKRRRIHNGTIHICWSQPGPPSHAPTSNPATLLLCSNLTSISLEKNCTTSCLPARPGHLQCCQTQNTKYRLHCVGQAGRQQASVGDRVARLQSSNELQQRRHVMARNCRPAISGNQLQPVGRHGQQCSPENQNLMTSTPLWLVNDHVLTMSCNGVQAWLPLINANVGQPPNLYEEVVGKK